MRLSGVAAFALAAVFTVAAPAMAAEPVVTVETGALQGASSDGVEAFKGIPFAQPPIGEMRWRPSAPAASWSGVRPAANYGPDCMQKPFPSDAAPLGVTPSEDCLYLNVWRPAQRSPRKLPVLVWIYGGGFVNGGSSPAVYDGSPFARQGLVFVSLNYRLGRFGFFAHPALTREDPNGLLGNYGYLDQIAALKWIKRNITAFGGDPDNVTVFGESAGGGSVHMLLTSALAKGLFQRAGIESGGGRGGLGQVYRLHAVSGVSGETIGAAFAEGKGIMADDPDALAKLRALPADQVIDNLNLSRIFNPGGPVTYSGPIIDGKIVTETPDQAYLAGRNARVPLLIGANSADIGMSNADTVDTALAPFGARSAQARAAYDPTGTEAARAIGTKVGMDRMMIEPARFVAKAFTAEGLPVYEFRFSYVAESMRGEWTTGAPHASEIPYVFDTVSAKYGAKLTPGDEAVARAANTYWANFAKTGDPNGAGLPRWPRYQPRTDGLMDFTAEGVARGGPDPWKARLDLTEAAASGRP